MIESYAAEGNCVARLDNGKVLFVDGVVPGDVIDVAVIKDKTAWAQGKMLRIVKPSDDRVVPFCKDFGVCGGCKWQMLPYELQLKYKQQQVVDQLGRIGNVKLPEMLPIIGSADERHYRNKLEFTFSTRRYLTFNEIADKDKETAQEPAFGFHAPGLFDKVVAVEQCYLQPDPSNQLLQMVRSYTQEHRLPYYDFKAQYGWLRNMIVRVASTGQVLVNLVIHHEMEEEREALLQYIWDNIPGVTSLNYTINGKVNDTIYDRDVVCWKGEDHIIEKLEGFSFKISPKSFFQTNTRQAENLYRVVRDFAGLTGGEVLYDLYCGTGSIGIFCSGNAAKIIGIEQVEDAIADARVNAAMNGLENCIYFAGDVAKICTPAFFAEHGRPDVVVTDPPRGGMHPALIDQLIKLAAPKVVYVSCNPATQARDLQMLDGAYEVTALRPVDMFPHTHHIENVALLTLRP